MKVQFIDTSNIKVNGEKTTLESIKGLQNQEFTIETKHGGILEFKQKHSPNTLIQLEKKKFYIEHFDQK